MAPSDPGRWHGHVHSNLLWQHAKTSVGTGTQGEGHCVATASVLGDRHQHPTAFLPLTEIFCVLTSLLAVVVFVVLLS